MARDASVRFPGRTLFLTEDGDALARQLAGESLAWRDDLALVDNISTDEITPGWVCYYYDETLAEYCLVGLRGGHIGRNAIKGGGFSVIVSGRSKGCGSSRETAPYSELKSGVGLVIARNIEKIYGQNAQNIGLLTSTDFGLIERIARGEAIWCQGYSEPNAGSDLANVQTRAELVDGQWVIEGQKVWTSLAHVSDWCFVIARTDPSAQKHKGLSYLLVPMRQPGVHIRPIVQITGSSEFNEVFFEGARCPADHVVGNPGDGWKVAMGTLAFERGASTLAQQLAFQNELDEIVAVARENGAAKDPLIRQRLAHAWSGLQIMRFNALRLLSEQPGQAPGRAAMITKLYWSNWHRDLGELAMAVLGARAELAEAPAEGEEYALTRLQRLFLFTRSDTIYAGSNEIQRNIIGERALGLPPEPRPGR